MQRWTRSRPPRLGLVVAILGVVGMVAWGETRDGGAQDRVTGVGPAPAREGGAGGDWSHWAPRIARCESGGDYGARNRRSGASGRYQVESATWARYGGFPEAAAAPPPVQEQHARALYQRAGLRPWRASRSCWTAAEGGGIPDRR